MVLGYGDVEMLTTFLTTLDKLPALLVAFLKAVYKYFSGKGR